MANNQDLYIGLMTGTSLDAVDAALVSFADGAPNTLEVIATREHPLPAELRSHLLQVITNPHAVDLDRYGCLHRELGLLYGAAVNELLASSRTHATQVTAIGCHGQTVRHNPHAANPFSLQIGDAATLANLTGIATVTDFRSADIALGGQGAPLVPGFHQWAFGSDAGAVINIGGIANITLTREPAPGGFDTGPGNVLLDGWCQLHTGQAFDHDGAWAASGKLLPELLQQMLADEYFSRQPPKSTGREHFNLDWLRRCLANTDGDVDPADVQATLCELTAVSIANAVQAECTGKAVWLCGGGALNSELRRRIGALLPDNKPGTTAELGIEPAWVEAIAFAWLARARILQHAAGSPSVTGARAAALLGSVYLPTQL